MPTNSANTMQVTIKNVYGEDKVYPACELSHGFCRLLKQKTLTLSDIETIKSMGFTVEVVSDKPKHL